MRNYVCMQEENKPANIIRHHTSVKTHMQTRQRHPCILAKSTTLITPAITPPRKVLMAWWALSVAVCKETIKSDKENTTHKRYYSSSHVHVQITRYTQESTQTAIREGPWLANYIILLCCALDPLSQGDLNCAPFFDARLTSFNQGASWHTTACHPLLIHP